MLLVLSLNMHSNMYQALSLASDQYDLLRLRHLNICNYNKYIEAWICSYQQLACLHLPCRMLLEVEVTHCPGQLTHYHIVG